jgi:hypothetical protein
MEDSKTWLALEDDTTHDLAGIINYTSMSIGCLAAILTY